MIVRHSYISVQSKRRSAGGRGARTLAIGTALGHIKYIQHRPGQDRSEGGREFFSDEEDQVHPKQFKQAIRNYRGNGVVVHKLMLAPEINPADPKAFTRQAMQELGAEKGLDLKWYGVVHKNTDHHHVHIVVMPKDKNGASVRFNKQDYDLLKEYGDRYLERHHPFEFREARRNREQKQKEKNQERIKERKALRQERIRDGIELPWMNKKIIRELYEPYDRWKKEQAVKEKENIKTEKQKDYFEYQGQNYNPNSSYEKLNELSKKLSKEDAERLPKEDYRLFKAWREIADRSHWADFMKDDFMDKEISRVERAEVRANEEPIPMATDEQPGDLQISSSPITGMFISATSLANAFIKSCLEDHSKDPLDVAEDRLHEDKLAKHQDYAKPSRTAAQKDSINESIEKIDKGLDNIKNTRRQRDIDKKKAQEKERDNDPFEFDPWGLY